MTKCIFLDRDGVINKDRPDYVYEDSHLEMIEGAVESITKFKLSGHLVVVVTNQSGISKGIYTVDQMKAINKRIKTACSGLIDEFYYSRWHPTMSESLSRKPGTLMFERAIVRFNIDISKSWMVGDKNRDMAPARQLGIKTIQVIGTDSLSADYKVADLRAAAQIILNSPES